MNSLSQLQMSDVRVRKNFTDCFTSSVCHSLSLGCCGFGQNVGRTISRDVWNLESALGLKDGLVLSMTLSRWKTQSSGFLERAASSDTLRAHVMATMKMVFNFTHLSLTSLMGSNCGFVRPRRTAFRLHVGNLCCCAGLRDVAPLRNRRTSGLCERDAAPSLEQSESTDSRVATCLLRVAGRRPISRPC